MTALQERSAYSVAAFVAEAVRIRPKSCTSALTTSCLAAPVGGLKIMDLLLSESSCGFSLPPVSHLPLRWKAPHVPWG
jgi:hypothetical protein